MEVVRIPKKLFEDKRLTPPERDFLSLLYHHFPPDETMTLRFKVPIRRLCEIAGRERRAVSYIVTSLKDKGWIRTNEGEGFWDTNRYFVGPPQDIQVQERQPVRFIHQLGGS